MGDLPGPAALEPFVGDFHLPAIADELVEDAEFVADAVAGGGDLQGGERFEEAGRQAAETSVAQAGFLLHVQDVFEVVDAEAAQGLGGLLLDAEHQQVVAQLRPDQELGGEIGHHPGGAGADRFDAGQIAGHQPIAHRVAQGHVEVMAAGRGGELAERVEEVLGHAVEHVVSGESAAIGVGVAARGRQTQSEGLVLGHGGLPGKDDRVAGMVEVRKACHRSTGLTVAMTAIASPDGPVEIRKPTCPGIRLNVAPLHSFHAFSTAAARDRQPPDGGGGNPDRGGPLPGDLCGRPSPGRADGAAAAAHDPWRAGCRCADRCVGSASDRASRSPRARDLGVDRSAIGPGRGEPRAGAGDLRRRPSPISQAVSKIGLYALLFLTGLESELDELVAVGMQATTVAVTGVVLPFALGTAGLLLPLPCAAVPGGLRRRGHDRHQHRHHRQRVRRAQVPQDPRRADGDRRRRARRHPRHRHPGGGGGPGRRRQPLASARSCKLVVAAGVFVAAALFLSRTAAPAVRLGAGPAQGPW